ncbi:hypothetical protein DFH07DRAFT_915474 [Mycena maculata]|uniref:Glycosyltransferase family 25 protein n=1 Tax=Mycena maculata TaxID=230809 RepID=A0AAD7NMX8_9AGAR|nr:hypothetical protein DFH07DRAFT_915474 [Mycena maculata]
MLPATSPRGIMPFAVGALITFLVVYFNSFYPHFRLASQSSNSILPVPSRTYVISLPRRTDRRQEMERLRALLDTHWTYVVAEDSESTLVAGLMAQVRSLRQNELRANGYLSIPNTTITLPFAWPAFTAPVEAMSSQEFLDPLPPVAIAPSSDSEPEQELPLTCATQNFTLTPYAPGIPEHKILSRSRIACWRSHLSAIRRAAAPTPSRQASLILEDDIDIEADIRAQLQSVWGLLPRDWDIVFLGHCWSNESYHPALSLSPARVQATSTHLHPSRAPLCTHAYALSPAGAARVLQHLAHPPYAYSRAIDHAFAWLVRSGRLKGFSVVPSVVVQRKIGASDVMRGTGSRWRERLVDGVLAGAGAG